jgi:hypothetical protein
MGFAAEGRKQTKATDETITESDAARRKKQKESAIY